MRHYDAIIDCLYIIYLLIITMRWHYYFRHFHYLLLSLLPPLLYAIRLLRDIDIFAITIHLRHMRFFITIITLLRHIIIFIDYYYYAAVFITAAAAAAAGIVIYHYYMRHAAISCCQRWWCCHYFSPLLMRDASNIATRHDADYYIIDAMLFIFAAFRDVAAMLFSRCHERWHYAFRRYAGAAAGDIIIIDAM